MAKTSQTYREAKRAKLRQKHAERRAELKELIRDHRTSLEEKRAAMARLEKLPLNASPVRRTNRCRLTGRSRGVYRKFGMSRIMLRQLALEGRIPGMTKSSW